MEKEVVKISFDVVNNPHTHPLIFYEWGKPEGRQEIVCIKCKELFRPPGLSCSEKDCNFHIHQSCIEVPNRIHIPFHRCRYEKNSYFFCFTDVCDCRCCGQRPYNAVYQCNQCNFYLDLQCMVSIPKVSSLIKTTSGEYRHYKHIYHPLILHHETDPADVKRSSIIQIMICFVCKRPIKPSSTYYFCPKFQLGCDSYTFHQQCAELPRQIIDSNIHHHLPLLLFYKPFTFICSCCKLDCTDFFYFCSVCNFCLHVHCLQSFNHEHDFLIFPNVMKFRCGLCESSNTTFPWYCTVCNLLAHQSCAIDLMFKQQLLSSSSTHDHRKISDNINNEIDLQHFSHEQHKLRLTRVREDTLCNGCMKYITAMSESYACPPCGFYLHKQCATLPTKQTKSFLHSHELSIVYIPDFVFSCALCYQYCHGFAYRCEGCCYTIDIRCVAITFPFKHFSHKQGQHCLTYYNGEVLKPSKLCRACGENLEYKRAFWCEECEFYLDVRCALLPDVVLNRFDEHPLFLTYGNSDVEEADERIEYYCDICEEERNVKQWSYQCKVCCFTAHINCVVGDYTFLKSAKIKDHEHPLTLVNEYCTKKRYSSGPSSCTCDVCGDSCADKLIFKCGNLTCNFNVHASGKCYIQQLTTQGQITFTMPSLRYRSIPTERWKLTSSSSMKAKLVLEKDKCSTALSFISQGHWRGKHWDDGVFSSIRSLKLYLNYSEIFGIEIEYEDKDGNSIRKQHGYHDDTVDDRNKVVTLNHPDEYLTSLHGWYDIHGIKSLSFETNQRTLGPYENYGDLHGSVVDNLIKFPTSTGLKIVGFHGRSIDKSDYHSEKLTAIGFHFIEI